GVPVGPQVQRPVKAGHDHQEQDGQDGQEALVAGDFGAGQSQGFHCCGPFSSGSSGVGRTAELAVSGLGAEVAGRGAESARLGAECAASAEAGSAWSAAGIGSAGPGAESLWACAPREDCTSCRCSRRWIWAGGTSVLVAITTTPVAATSAAMRQKSS